MKIRIILSFAVAIATPLIAATTFAATTTFSDVSTNEIYYDAITFLAQNGIVNGNPDGTFKPLNTINRAEMIKIIAEGAAKYYNWNPTVFDGYKSQNCFSDVKPNQWYTKYVCYGMERGWVKGYSDGSYRPNQTVSFVEGLKIAFHGFGIPYEEDETPWYKTSVDSASEKNFIPFTVHSFTNGLKRNAMADLVTRIIKTKEGILDEYLGTRSDTVVTYDTIKKDLDLSALQIQNLSVGP